MQGLQRKEHKKIALQPTKVKVLSKQKPQGYFYPYSTKKVRESQVD